MTNSEIAAALQRWSHEPRIGERAQEALARAGRRLLFIDTSIEEHAAAGTRTDVPRVGPFVARMIRELLDGSRPLHPAVDSWPEPSRKAYDATEPARQNYIALYDDSAVAHLVTAGAPFERVINYWPLPELEAWLQRKASLGARWD